MENAEAQAAFALNTLRAEIEKAFRSTELPTTKMLRPYDAHEQAIIDTFDHRHWNEVDVFRPEIYNSPALFLLEDKWLHFYLPAYLLATLGPPTDLPLARSLLEILTPPVNPEFRNKIFEPRVDLLTSEQRTIVVSFITHVLGLYPKLSVRSADLVAYWFNERKKRISFAC